MSSGGSSASISVAEAQPLWKLLAAYAALYIIWGSTYFAIRIAIQSLPSFLMGGVRFILAGMVMLAWGAATSRERPTAVQWRAALVVGAFLMLGGNGAIVWAEHRIPSSVAAVIVSTLPVWMVLLDWVSRRGPRPDPAVVVGMVMGIGGTAILVGPGAGAGSLDPLAAGIVLLSTVCWAIGSLISRNAPAPESPKLAVGMQMLCGGALLTALGLAAGEAPSVEPSRFTGSSLLALAYLFVVGSLVAFSAYVWLLRVAPPARVATYAYVNPVVAVAIGVFLGGERLSPHALLGAAVIVAGVVVITTARSSAPARRPVRPSAAESRRCDDAAGRPPLRSTD
jgi:drug/metabolite transporter (DMT)-like permease